MDQAEPHEGETIKSGGRKIAPKRRSAGVHQVILSHIEEHSKKPEEARRRIVELMGDLPRIELFARQKADGWDAWGTRSPVMLR